MHPEGLPHDMPVQLAEAVARSGGDFVIMDDREDGILTRAAALRETITKFDRVVLHIHPHDAAPLIAIAEDEGPPVILLNHAEHVFWPGASAVDIVAHLREESATISESFRGIERNRSFVLPIPLAPTTGMWSHEKAKRLLDLPSESIVLLTVGSAYKYKTDDGQHFVDAILPVIERHPAAVLLAVGPEGDSSWEAAKTMSGDRIRACGRRDDVERFFAAADVYLDSFPIGSITAVLEAALHGLPIVQCELPTPTLLPTTDAALSGFLIREKLETYADRIASLVANETARRAIGAEIRERVSGLHTGERWQSLLRELYAHATRAPRPRPRIRVDEARSIEATDQWVQWMAETTGFSRDFSEKQLIAHSRFMPADRRLILAGRAREATRLITPIDVRTRAHFERPRRYVAADAIKPASWPLFMKTLLRTAKAQARDATRATWPRRHRSAPKRGGFISRT